MPLKDDIKKALFLKCDFVGFSLPPCSRAQYGQSELIPTEEQRCRIEEQWSGRDWIRKRERKGMIMRQIRNCVLANFVQSSSRGSKTRWKREEKQPKMNLENSYLAQCLKIIKNVSFEFFEFWVFNDWPFLLAFLMNFCPLKM